MRIIAGTLGSRRLEAPPGLSTRPTSDRLRETLFNVLAPRMDSVIGGGTAGGAVFLDLYAGSGAVGLEALSRGAAHVTFVERSPVALKVLRRNLERLGIESGFAVCAESVAAFLRAAAKAKPKPREGAKPERREVGSPNRYQVVFLDPPYDAAEEYAATLGVLGEAQGILAPGALVIAEHRAERGRRQSLEDQYGSLKRTRLLEQGDAALSFYETAPTLSEQAPAELP
jgi:16S rRNA (guanine(966)-N(2))-methyltransferase RsmD